jgi:L-threonylcarbamoyladenylate synthase
MKILKDKSLNWGTSEGAALFTDLIKKHKIILGPSDTIIGLYGLPVQQSYARINELKNRCDKPYLLLIRDRATAYNYIEQGQLEKFKTVLDACWPGPLTVIAHAKKDAPYWLTSGRSTIAIRVPRHPILQKILQEVPALFSTSANLSGELIALTLEEVTQSIKDGVDAIVMDPSSQVQSVPSTIIDITGGEIEIVREGAYPKDFFKNRVV